MVLNMSLGEYKPDDDFPLEEDKMGLKRVLATIPSLFSRKYEGALYPIELVNGIASMSNYPSAKILQILKEILLGSNVRIMILLNYLNFYMR